MRHYKPKIIYPLAGFSLVELMLAMLLSSFLLLGLISSFSASSKAFSAISNRYELLLNANRGLGHIEAAVREAGYPNIDTHDYPAAIAVQSRKAASNDVLVVEGWSRQNCFGNTNPDTDSQSRPRLYFRQQQFQLQAGSLRWRCAYGFDSASMHTQINNQALIDNVALFRVKYFEDSDLDGNTDSAVDAGHWLHRQNIQQLEISLSLYVDTPDQQSLFKSIIRLRNAS